MKFRQILQLTFFLGVIFLLFFSCNKEPSLRECVAGDWVVNALRIDGTGINPQNMEFEFDEDGDFTLNLTFSGTRYSMQGDWEINESSEEIELTYDIEATFYVGLIGIGQGRDITREEYDITKRGENDLEFEGIIEGIDVELSLERD